MADRKSVDSESKKGQYSIPYGSAAAPQQPVSTRPVASDSGSAGSGSSGGAGGTTGGQGGGTGSQDTQGG